MTAKLRIWIVGALVLLWAVGVVTGVFMERARHHQPPCHDGETEIYWFNPETGDHWASCEQNLPAR